MNMELTLQDYLVKMAGRCNQQLGFSQFVAESIQNPDSGGSLYERVYSRSGYEHESEKNFRIFLASISTS